MLSSWLVVPFPVIGQMTGIQKAEDIPSNFEVSCTYNSPACLSIVIKSELCCALGFAFPLPFYFIFLQIGSSVSIYYALFSYTFRVPFFF